MTTTTTEATRKRSTRPIEIVLMDKIWNALAQLNSAERNRVMYYLVSKHSEPQQEEAHDGIIG